MSSAGLFPLHLRVSVQVRYKMAPRARPGAPRFISSMGSVNILSGLEAGKERNQKEFVANFDKKV